MTSGSNTSMSDARGFVSLMESLKEAVKNKLGAEVGKQIDRLAKQSSGFLGTYNTAKSHSGILGSLRAFNESPSAEAARPATEAMLVQKAKFAGGEAFDEIEKQARCRVKLCCT